MALYEPAPNRRLIGGQLVLFGAWFAVTVVGALLHPSRTGHGTHEQLGLPPCPSALLFDRPCPGCGLTTSWTALIHGDFAFAFHAHPLGPFLYLFFTVMALLALRGWIAQRRLITDSPKFNRALVIGAAAFLCFGVARMVVMPNYRTVQDIAAMR
jgi:hypothetical protein